MSREAMADARENALIMIASVRAALKNGVKHFTVDDHPLETELGVLTALREDGEIVFDVTERVQRTTDEEELAAVREEFAGRWV